MAKKLQALPSRDNNLSPALRSTLGIISGYIHYFNPDYQAVFQLQKPAFQSTNTVIDDNPMVMQLFFRIIASVLQLK